MPSITSLIGQYCIVHGYEHQEVYLVCDFCNELRPKLTACTSINRKGTKIGAKHFKQDDRFHWEQQTGICSMTSIHGFKSHSLHATLGISIHFI
jgi:hypothetical protein